jgi:hypothetical protein
MSLAAAACLVPNIGRCGGYRVHMIAILHLDGDRHNPDHGVPAQLEQDISRHMIQQSSNTLTCIIMFPRTPQSPARPRPVSWALPDLACSTPARGSRTSLTADRAWPTVTTPETPSSHPRIFENQALVRVCDCIGSVLRAKPTTASLVLDGARSQTVSGHHHDSASPCDMELFSKCYNFITARQHIMHGLDGRKQFLIGENWHSVWVGS